MGLRKGAGTRVTALLFQTSLHDQHKTGKRGLGIARVTCPDKRRAHACAHAHLSPPRARCLGPGPRSLAPAAGLCGGRENSCFAVTGEAQAAAEVSRGKEKMLDSPAAPSFV